MQRKRNARRHKRRSRGPNMVKSVSSPIPDRYMVKLKYADTIALTSAATPVAHLFRTNSLFDPDYTGVGHQPYGYDQLTPLYSQYRVFGISYKITFTNISSGPMDVAVVLKSVVALSTVWNTIEEKPYVKVRHLAMPTAGGSIQVIKGYVSNPKLLGITKEQYRTNTLYQGTATANPLESGYLHIYADQPGGTTGLTVYANVELHYFAVFHGRIPLTGS